MDYIQVRTIDGRDVLIFRQAIVTVGSPRSGDNQPMLTAGAKCQITLVDGKFIAVVESCDSLRKRLEEKP